DASAGPRCYLAPARVGLGREAGKGEGPKAMKKARNLSALLAIGALSLGAAACGSSSSSSSNSAPTGADGTVAADVIKEASTYRYVQLTVKNDTTPQQDPDTGPWFYLCFKLPSDCGDGNGIKPDPPRGGDGVTATAPSSTLPDDDVKGELAFPVGYTFWVFTAHNPVSARPTIALDKYTT